MQPWQLEPVSKENENYLSFLPYHILNELTPSLLTKPRAASRSSATYPPPGISAAHWPAAPASHTPFPASSPGDAAPAPATRGCHGGTPSLAPPIPARKP